MEFKTITYQSSTIYYRITGKGKPVILIHGFGEDGEIWNRQVDFLKDHFKLIVPDLPGSGKSEMINDMSIEGMGEVIKEVMNIELQKFPPQRTERVILIGHSMGGYITLAFVEKYPDLLSAFALIHSSAYADSEEKKSARLKSIEFIKTNGAYEFIKTAIPGLFKPSENAGPSETYIADLIEKGKGFAPEALIHYYRSMINRVDKTAVLKNFSRPVLLIIGEYDNAVPFEQSMQQTYLPHQTYIHILRNSGHMGLFEETEKVNRALLEFLNRQPD